MSPILKPRGSVFNARTVTAPVAALTMALLLYTYSVTSIRAAKRNAQLHREADGGQLDMRRESLRRHGVLDQVPKTGGVQLFRDVGGREERGKARGESGRMGEKRARSLGEVLAAEGEGDGKGVEEGKVPRTRVEGSLEGYKGRGRAVERFREERSERPEVPEAVGE